MVLTLTDHREDGICTFRDLVLLVWWDSGKASQGRDSVPSDFFSVPGPHPLLTVLNSLYFAFPGWGGYHSQRFLLLKETLGSLIPTRTREISLEKGKGKARIYLMYDSRSFSVFMSTSKAEPGHETGIYQQEE